MTDTKLVHLPDKAEIEQYTARQRWNLEESLVGATGILRQYNDDELRAWVEAGKTSREIGELVNRNQSNIVRRAKRLGLTFKDSRGGDRSDADASEPSDNGDGEVVDGEVVEPAKPTRTQRTERLRGPGPQGGAGRINGEEIDSPRWRLVDIAILTHDLRKALEGGEAIEPGDAADRKRLLHDVEETIQTLQLAKQRLKNTSKENSAPEGVEA